jgi:methyl-accepting chemotaxis protein
VAQQPDQVQPAQNQQKAQPSAAPTFKRKQIYINMDLQFKYSLILIFTMFIEMIIIGLAMLYVISQPKPDIPGANIYFIYRVVLIVILMLTLCNITVGVYLSHKVAGPLFRLMMCTKEVANGNLRIQVNLRKGDELRELEATFNDMTERLRSQVREERRRIEEIVAAVDKVSADVGKSGKTQEQLTFIRETVQKINSQYTI